MSLFRSVINKQHYYIAGGIVAASLVFKFIYIFYFTSFRDSLWCDMGAYWYDSYQRVWGDVSSINQWGNFPPFYKYYFLPPILRLINGIGWLSYALPLVILMNILFYGVSACIFYMIVSRLITNKIAALLALVFYAFSYLAVYMNATVLPENATVPLVMASIGIIILTEIRFSVLISGLLLGIAIAVKPFLLVFSPAFMGYIYNKEEGRDKVWKAFVFILALGIVPLITVAENYRVSHGKLKSLASIGGVNFFQGWAKVGEVRTTSPEGTGSYYSPGALDEPTWKSVTVKEPWYHQGYFYHLGLKSIRHNPSVLLEKFFWFKKFFWGNLGPSLKRPPAGYGLIMPTVENISYIMFLSFIFLYSFFKRQIGSGAIVFLFSILMSFFIFIYAFGLPERRYFINIEFLIIALFFVMVNKIIFLYRAYRNEVWFYGIFVFAFFICIPATREYFKIVSGI